MKLRVNGRAVDVREGATLLQAARAIGIEIPTLCHDDRLRPAAVCRLCLVGVSGVPHLVPACATPAAEGMEVETHTPEIEETRRTMLWLLADDYPVDAVERWPEKQFHRWLRHYQVSAGADAWRLTSSPSPKKPSLVRSAPAKLFRDSSHPYLHADMSRCIDCFRCVRICAELQGQFVWHVAGPGNAAGIVPDGPTLLTSSCVSCGACVDTCPTGALEDQSILNRGLPTQWTRTTCPYCGVGCEMNVGTRNGRIVQIKPVLDAPVSKGHLCVKGRYAFDFAHTDDRVTEPMIREDVLERFRATREGNAPFPLTPALSPEERETRTPSSEESKAPDHPLRDASGEERRTIPRLAEPSVRSRRGDEADPSRSPRLPPPHVGGYQVLGRGEGERGEHPRGRWCTVSWPEAIECVATNLHRIREETGPDSIGLLGSARGTNEENYLAQKFARVVLGTNNVDCCARVCHAPTAAGMKQTLGTGAATNSFNDIEHAGAFLLCGCNPTENHPIVGARIRQAVLHGARLIVIDPREIELTRHADVHLQLRPGTNVPLLHGLAHVIVTEGLTDATALRDRVSDFEAYRGFIAGWTPERAETITGVSADLIRQAARLYATRKPAMCFHGLGVTEHIQGTEGVTCLVSLALLTGNFGKPGSGVNPLRGQNNVQGSAHMGCEPDHLTGYVDLFDSVPTTDPGKTSVTPGGTLPLTPALSPGEREIRTPSSEESKAPDHSLRDASGEEQRTIPPLPGGEGRGEGERASLEPSGNNPRELFEKIWGAPVPGTPGLNLMQMMDAAAEEKLKALWAIGYDIALTNPNATATKAALAKLDFIVVQDLFMNELAREFGHVFLPACSSFEKDGTFMNSERRVQRVRQVLEPIGKSKADWAIVGAVATAMGFGEKFAFNSAEEIWNEVRAVWKAGAGISYARIEHGGLQWPCPSDDHPGTSILHTDRFPHGARASLCRAEYAATTETRGGEYPFLLTTGRTLYQFNAGTMTMRTPNAQLRATDTLDIAPVDAGRLGLIDGDSVRVRSRHGEALISLRLDPRVKPGELFATFHVAEVFLNRLTSPHRDRVAMTPEYKVVAVAVERV